MKTNENRQSQANNLAAQCRLTHVTRGEGSCTAHFSNGGAGGRWISGHDGQSQCSGSLSMRIDGVGVFMDVNLHEAWKHAKEE